MKLIRISDSCVVDISQVLSYDVKDCGIEFNFINRDIIVAGFNNNMEAMVVFNNLNETLGIRDIRFTKIEETNPKDKKEKGFEMFWSLYDKKVDKPNTKKTFMNLTLQDMGLVIKAVSKYVESTPDKKWRKNPRTWLNTKGWEDEIMSDGELKEKNRYKKPNYITDDR